MAQSFNFLSVITYYEYIRARSILKFIMKRLAYSQLRRLNRKGQDF